MPTGTPKAIKVVLSLEEALKLHLSLGQLLGHLNGYNRSTSDENRMGVDLCIYTERERIAVVDGKIRKLGKSSDAHVDGDDDGVTS